MNVIQRHIKHIKRLVVLFILNYDFVNNMYIHDKNNIFREYLRWKSKVSKQESLEEIEGIEFSKLPTVVEIFNHARMREILDEHDRRSNLHRNNKRFLGYLGNTSGFLQLIELPMSIFDDLEELRARFPNFSTVIDFYKEQFALSLLGETRVFSASPLLMAGPPGVGKTTFCHELAKLIKTHFELISLSGMTASFVLGGMSSGWAEGKPGKVVEAIARSCVGNPIMVLDEIDKSGGDKRYDPLGVLLQLLEKQTAKSFVDEALEVQADCSFVVWIATANYVNLIAEPILSRFTIIEVPAPSDEQMVKVINSVYKKILKNHDWGTKFVEQLDEAVINKIIESKMGPRSIQRELKSACGKAVLRTQEQQCNRESKLFEITLDDLSVSSTAQLLIPQQPQIKHGANIFMPIFSIAPIEQEPEETIVFWSVREVIFGQEADKSHHLVGYIHREHSGRVTSAIQEFDRDSMTVKTKSGRVYFLKGQPGFNADAEYVWNKWKAINDARDEVDVTNQYWVMH